MRNMPADANSLSCLLCSSKHLKHSDQLTGREIRALWHEGGREFPPEAMVGIHDNSNIILWQCTICGFEFFDPSLAGNSLFYQCLESSEYYSPDRPEFQRTSRFAVNRGLANVLDVGCGVGDFLDLARTSGLRTFGLELNPTAAGKARAKGHEILTGFCTRCRRMRVPVVSISFPFFKCWNMSRIRLVSSTKPLPS